MIGEQALDRVHSTVVQLGHYYRYLDDVLVCLHGLAGWINMAWVLQRSLHRGWRV